MSDEEAQEVAEQAPEEEPETTEEAESGEAGAESPDAAELDAEALAGVARDFAATFSKDLSALLGADASLSVQGTSVAQPDALVCPDAVVDQLARCEGEPARSLHVLVPVADAVGMGALQAGGEGDAVTEAREGGDFAAHAEAFGEVMKLAAAVLSKLLEPHGVGPLALQDARPLEDAASDTSWLGDAAQWCLRLELGVEGFDGAPLLVLLEKVEGDGEADAALEDLSVVIIDPDGEERDRIEEVGEQKGREIAAIDPAEFDDDSRESIEEADAVIVAWQLGGRSGLELVEHLVRHEQTSGTPALLAHDLAHRGMVESALRAGARGFVLRPYDVEEIEKAVTAARRS